MIPSRTARLAVSSKYPNAVDQLITRSKRPVHGSWRMSPATYSTLTHGGRVGAGPIQEGRRGVKASDPAAAGSQPVGQFPVPAGQIQHAQAGNHHGQQPHYGGT